MLEVIMRRLLYVLTMTTVAWAQAPDSLWMVQCGRANGDEFGGPGVTLSDNGALIFGAVNGGTRPWIVRFDFRGDTLWTRTWDSLSNLQVTSVLPLSDSLFLVAGNRAGGDNARIWLGYVNGSGIPLQTVYFAATNRRYCSDIIRTMNGDFVLAGYEESNSNYQQQQLAIRLTPQLEVAWEQRYGNFGWEEKLTSVCELPNTDLVFTGSRTNLPQGYGLPFALHTSGAGLESNSVFLADEHSSVRLGKVYPRPGGGTLLCGYMPYNSSQTYFFRMSPLDQLEDFSSIYFSGGYFNYAACARTAAGEILVTGTVEQYNIGNQDFAVLKVSGEGYYDWDTTFGSAGDESASWIGVLPQGDFMVAGTARTATYPTQTDVSLFRSGVRPLHFSPPLVEYGEVSIGSSIDHQVFASNVLDHAVRISSVQVPDGFALITPLPLWIAPGASAGFEISFEPLLRASYEGSVRVQIDDPDLTLRFTLDGAGVLGGSHDWRRHFGSADAEEGLAIAALLDGGYVCAGTRIQSISGIPDLWIVRGEHNGDSTWSYTFDGINADVAQCAIATADGGFAVAGYTNSLGAGSSDFLLLKFAADNRLEFLRAYGGAQSERCYSVVQTADGGYALAGSTASYGAGGQDFWLVRLDVNGDTLWTRTYGGAFFDGCQGGNSHDGCQDIIVTRDGNFVLAGWTSSFQAQMADGLILKVSQLGDSIWNYSIGGEGHDSLFSVAELSDGQLVFAGYSRASLTSSRDFWAYGATDRGVLQWSQTFGGAHDQECRAVGVRPGDELLFAGYTDRSGDGNRDAWLVETAPWGDSLWTACIGTPDDDDDCRALALQPDGGGFMVGTTYSTGNAGDIWVVRLLPDSQLAVAPARPTPQNHALVYNYPNPFNAATTIAYELPEASDVSLSIYNLNGETVQAVEFKQQTAGKHEFMFDGHQLASGLYFVQLRGRNYSASAKMILLK
jgi:uncharacterized delta-60 repeat protein